MNNLERNDYVTDVRTNLNGFVRDIMLRDGEVWVCIRWFGINSSTVAPVKDLTHVQKDFSNRYVGPQTRHHGRSIMPIARFTS